MIKFFLVCIISIHLFSVDIDALKKEKLEYKLNHTMKYAKLYKKDNIDERHLVIVFKKKIDTDMQILEKKYFLVQMKCLVKTVCIFKKNIDSNISYDVDKIKSEFQNIEEIKYYRRYKFRAY